MEKMAIIIALATSIINLLSSVISVKKAKADK